MNDSEQTISVLLPVHAGVEPAHLEAALGSLMEQSHPPDEIVVVEDGALPDGHLVLLDALVGDHSNVVRVRLATNSGAGIANQAGLLVATGVWVAKADADDISMPSRFEKQLAHLRQTGADVCGSAMLEFEDEVTRITARRGAPVRHASIARRMRWNNPINHPTAMYRRELALASGGYPTLRLMQDYLLFARMLSSGARMTNLSEPLVYFRAGQRLHSRRSGSGFAALEREVQLELRSLGLVSRPRSWFNFLVRMGYRLLPRTLMRWVHGHVLSRPMATREMVR